ncbi:NAD(P)-dependent alcohol dehydrogenase [Gordonia paraffinivorans]|uniref:NAD(P)-dependent alcohol dehydrogenase n=1 Tax=Gordonia paraffinivorans TaxID=175628 RepID=UPI001E516551|nr:NAD(P)-dependent alcohol dehydrogenase [Gordonia paraffinivorans]MCD2146959.1 NAD(P)-dependent alcohol dehydrogenase [Gordonia paraffinivorans]
MKALQYTAFGEEPTVVDIPRPSPGPGQVLLRVTAAGVCHSDLHIMASPPEEYRYGPLPLTLGHEAAGVVVSSGPGADHFPADTPVLVYGPWGCGICRSCARGEENYCTDPAGVHPPGISVAGAMAEYMLVDAERHLVPLRDLDPVQAVALTDAGLTSYHAINGSRHRLGAGTYALVIGAGGLGHIAIQILRALGASTVIAADVSEEKLRLAREVGAHHCVIANEAAADEIGRLTAGAGVDAIFDFVGTERTVGLAGSVAATHGDIVIVGVGNGALPVGYRRQPFETSVRSTFWGSRSDLWEVVDLARAGLIRVAVETHPLLDAPTAYKRLAEGKVLGRAVIVP